LFRTLEETRMPSATRCTCAGLLCGFLLGLDLVIPSRAAAPAPDAEMHFEKRIRPLFLARCVKCHGADKAKGGLRLDAAEFFTRGGGSGAAVVPGKPDASLLIEAVRQTGELKMPPGGKLSESEIGDLVDWVRSGARWPAKSERTGSSVSSSGQPAPSAAHFTPAEKAFWAFQPVRDVPLPKVRDTAWPATPVDCFILAKLEEKSLRPAAAADRRTWLRRVTFDLTGLPPTPEEIADFLEDRSARAFPRVVDRLLASPGYGERWGRHWLDVVRYADTTANDANAVMRFAYRYRDYVVQAFNRDKPYDQFILEQLAGDLLPGPTDLPTRAERVIATGFLMVGPKALAETDKEQTRLDIADEQLDVTSRAFLGLTVSCARCHDHKFDPIPTVDYYSLAGIFRSTDPLLDEAPNSSMWQEWPLVPAPGAAPLLVMAPREGRPINLRVHRRGNRFTLGQPAPRRFLQILAGENHAPLTTTQSGRLELARWIASPGHPLTARVMVNRIWQYHFGTGLVATSDNFGARGERSSHPELLDWLAARFVESGWSVKTLHRQIVLSSTYRMARVTDDRAARVDPGNRLLWRMPRRRLEAEALRDAILAVSGQLDRKPGGEESSAFLYREAEILDAKRGFNANRVKSDHTWYGQFRGRSIYLPVVRNMLPDVLTLFDAADPNGVTAVRNDTTVPAQALFLLNNPFVREQAASFSRLVLAQGGEDRERVRLAHVRALGRSLRGEELAEALEFVREYTNRARSLGRPEAEARLGAWQSYCQMLLCCNEFLYIE
jgi:cytochrome c553